MEQQLEGNVVVTSTVADGPNTEKAMKSSLGLSNVISHSQIQAEIISLADQSFSDKISTLQQNMRVVSMFKNANVTIESTDISTKQKYYKIINGADLDGTPGQAVVIEEFQTDLGLKVGDSIVVRINQKLQPITIAGFYKSGTVKTAFIRMSDQDMQGYDQASRLTYYVNADGESFNRLFSELPASAMAYSLNQAVIDGLQDVLTLQKNIFTLISVFTLFIAMLMIANQFINSMLQSTFDFAVLKACGVTNRQIKKSLLLENTIISLTGGVIGTFVSFFVAAIGELLVSGYADVPVRLNWFLGGCGIALLISFAVTIILSRSISQIRPIVLLKQG
jgi:putative ABC transport system permease protein